jgi:hypothetical protein
MCQLPATRPGIVLNVGFSNQRSETIDTERADEKNILVNDGYRQDIIFGRTSVKYAVLMALDDRNSFQVWLLLRINCG